MKMFFGRNRIRNIVIRNSEFIIDFNLTTEKKIAINQLDKVYISFEKISKSYKISYLMISILCIIVVGVFISSFPILSVLTLVLLIIYRTIHSYKMCTLNFVLENDAIAIRFIPFKFKYEVVLLINELKKLINTPEEEVLRIEFSKYVIPENCAV